MSDSVGDCGAGVCVGHARASRVQTNAGGIGRDSQGGNRVLPLRGPAGYKPREPLCNFPARTKSMAVERTFSIIKPDATQRNLTGAINALIEQAGLRIVAQKRLRMSRAEAETFYAVHRERPFFGELVEFMTSGPVV